MADAYVPGQSVLLERRVRATVLDQYCNLNWRVRLEEDGQVGGSRIKAGATYIAGVSQLRPAPPPSPGEEKP